MKTTDYKSFHYLENGEVAFSSLDTVKSTNTLDPGFYNVTYLEYPMNKVRLSKQTTIETVKVHSFPEKEKIDNLIAAFFDEKTIENVKEFGFNHKVGVLFYGKEGTGKSSIMKHYAARLVKEQNAIVFNINRYDSMMENCWSFIMSIRQIQDNPIVIILDEIDTYLKTNTNEAQLKMMLDGNLSINNCIFMASTNYIDNLPTALKDRPSRFKYRCDIEGIQNPEDVYDILFKLIGKNFTEEQTREFSEDLKGSTLDTIKQFCLDKVMDLTITLPKRNHTIGFRQN